MDFITSYLKKYDYHYDSKYKIFTIRKPISVKEFMYLRNLLKYTGMDIDDIRVELKDNMRSSYERRF